MQNHIIIVYYPTFFFIHLVYLPDQQKLHEGENIQDNAMNQAKLFGEQHMSFIQQIFVHGNFGIDGIEMRIHTLFVDDAVVVVVVINTFVVIVMFVIGGGDGRYVPHHIMNSGLPAANLGQALKTRWNAASDQEAICKQWHITYAMIPPIPHRVAGHELFDFVAELHPR